VDLVSSEDTVLPDALQRVERRVRQIEAKLLELDDRIQILEELVGDIADALGQRGLPGPCLHSTFC